MLRSQCLNLKFAPRTSPVLVVNCGADNALLLYYVAKFDKITLIVTFQVTEALRFLPDPVFVFVTLILGHD